jgi:hypothetical protein
MRTEKEHLAPASLAALIGGPNGRVRSNTPSLLLDLDLRGAL